MAQREQHERVKKMDRLADKLFGHKAVVVAILVVIAMASGLAMANLGGGAGGVSFERTDGSDSLVEPGSGEVGVLAVGGPIPVGYYKDPEKTAATFQRIGDRVWIEVNVQERPRLGNFRFVGPKKTEAEELQTKLNLVKQTIITENTRREIVEKTTKFS